MEAFMYRFHPQWLKARDLVEAGAIGEVRTIQSFFSYYNADPGNIRNMVDIGGGGLMDIGCYCLSFGRFIFSKEPERVVASVEYDPILKTDRMASGILQFSGGQTATFTCSTQLMPYQRCLIFGTTGFIDVEIPVNASVDTETRLWLVTKTGREQFTFDICDQYALQGDAFSQAILDDAEVPTKLEDAVHNMKVLDALVTSGKEGSWVDV
jgi:predicted dehydrogenase